MAWAHEAVSHSPAGLISRWFKLPPSAARPDLHLHIPSISDVLSGNQPSEGRSIHDLVISQGWGPGRFVGKRARSLVRFPPRFHQFWLPEYGPCLVDRDQAAGEGHHANRTSRQ